MINAMVSVQSATRTKARPKRLKTARKLMIYVCRIISYQRLTITHVSWDDSYHVMNLGIVCSILRMWILFVLYPKFTTHTKL